MSNSPHDSALIQQVSWQEAASQLSAIRRQVFIVEQNVPEELEWDNEDTDAFHVLAFLDNQAIATGRLLRSGYVGRMAVLSPYRGIGIGTKILNELLAVAAQHSLGYVFLHAQLHAKAFYAKHHFLATGAEFEEAGIPHVRMDLYL